MSSKRQDDLFPTTALVPATYHGPTTLAPSERSRGLVKAEQKIAQEAHKQQYAIEQQRRKTGVAQAAIGSLHESAVQTFTKSADDIWAARASNGRDAELQRYIDHYAAQQIQSAGSSIHAATIAGTERILVEVSRPIDADIKEPRGLLAILRGEKE
jgi:hypothetical protein